MLPLDQHLIKLEGRISIHDWTAPHPCYLKSDHRQAASQVTAGQRPFTQEINHSFVKEMSERPSLDFSDTTDLDEFVQHSLNVTAVNIRTVGKWTHYLGFYLSEDTVISSC